MPRRQKNLLEAFSKSGDAKHAPKLPGLTPPTEPKLEPEPQPEPRRSAAKAKKAMKADKPKPRPAARRAEPVIPRRAPLDVDPRRLAILGGVLVLLAVVFLSGRWTADDVAAGEAAGGLGGNRMLDPGERAPLAAPPSPGEPLRDVGLADPAPPPAAERAYTTEDDRAFHDPANAYTVRVIEFRNDGRGADLAWDCYRYLRAQGFPAISPIEQGRSIMLYVGAGSDLAALRALADELAALPGPPPQSRPGEFEGAYPVNISEQIERDDP